MMVFGQSFSAINLAESLQSIDSPPTCSNSHAMSLPRFLVPSLIRSAGELTLPDDESHHASRVLRCEPGDPVVVFDGIGNQASAIIRHVSKKSVTVGIESVVFAPRDHQNRLHFAVAMPKGDRQRNTIEKLVELGVDSLTPISTERSVAIVGPANSERLARYVIEACKQCGRNRLMTIHPCVTIEQLAWDDEPTQCKWILHPDLPNGEGWSVQKANSLMLSRSIESVLFLVGPEGGFSDTEVAKTIARQAKVLSLGERIQRVETAVSTAAVLGSIWLENE
jgi:16S rRNA (uracil1498-N3)-methyltransferase